MQHIKFKIGHLITTDKAIITPKQKWIHKDNNWIVEIKCCNKANPNHIDIDAILPDSVEFYLDNKKLERNYTEFIQNYDLILFENFLENFNSNEIIEMMYEKILNDIKGWYDFLDKFSYNINTLYLKYIMDSLKKNEFATYQNALGAFVSNLKDEKYIIIEPRNLSEEIELETLLENYDRI